MLLVGRRLLSDHLPTRRPSVAFLSALSASASAEVSQRHCGRHHGPHRRHHFGCRHEIVTGACGYEATNQSTRNTLAETFRSEMRRLSACLFLYRCRGGIRGMHAEKNIDVVSFAKVRARIGLDLPERPRFIAGRSVHESPDVS
jgi:hypothetical protein